MMAPVFEHCRAHPFFTQDPVAVALSDDDLAKWMETNFLVLNNQSPKAFADAYELPIVTQAQAGAGRPQRFTGPPERRICAICGRSSSEASFKKVAHLIPEAFGNKSLFTNEECDECNAHHGSSSDEQLAMMWNADRVLSCIPGKKGRVRAAARSGSSYIGSKDDPDIVDIVQKPADDSVLITQNPDSVQIVFPQVRYKPMSALRSVARMAYLTLHPNVRSRCTVTLDWIRDESAVPAAAFVDFRYAGKPSSFVGISVWVRRESENREIPQFVAMFYANSRILLMAGAGEALSPIPLPWLPRRHVGDVQTEISYESLVCMPGEVTVRPVRVINVTRRWFEADGPNALPRAVVVRIRPTPQSDALVELKAHFSSLNSTIVGVEHVYAVTCLEIPASFKFWGTVDNKWHCALTAHESADASTELAVAFSSLFSEGSLQVVSDGGIQMFPPTKGEWAGPFLSAVDSAV